MACLEDDLNYKAYTRLLESNILYNIYRGKYVLFIGGALKCCGSNKDDFLTKIRKTYPDNELFVAKVTKEKEIIEIPEFSVKE